MGVNLRVFGVVLGTIVFYGLLANMIPQVQSEVPEELTLGAEASAEELVGAGEQLYAGAGGCTACHGLGTRAPNLVTDDRGSGTIGARCGSRVAGETCEEYLWISMTEPNAHVVEGFEPIMPDMRRVLSEAQLWTIVAYLQSVGGEVTVTGARVAEAQAAASGDGAATGGATGGALAGGSTDPEQLLTVGTCTACHVINGTGGPIGPPLDGVGGRLSAAEIRMSILRPNADTSAGYEAMAGTMPATFGAQFNADQLEALVEYLAGLQ